MQTDYHRDFTNLHKMIDMVSGATKCTEASRYYLIITVIFSDFIYSCIRSYKINKTNKLATNNNSTGSYEKVMDLKILPEPSNGLVMLQTNYQVSFLPDYLFMHLTLDKLAFSFEIQNDQCCM